MRAARVGASDVIARPAKGEFMRMGRLLEAGSQGIMYPRCESAEEAAELVRWAKFAPQGERGANGDNPYCAIPMVPYLKAANEHTLLIAQLESPNALDQATAIAAVRLRLTVKRVLPNYFCIRAYYSGQTFSRCRRGPAWNLEVCNPSRESTQTHD